MLCHVNSDEVEIINVSLKERVSLSGSDKGVQIKWLSGNRVVKLNAWGRYEGISEVLVSYLLNFTNINYFVEYYPCVIYEDGMYRGLGCYSYNFLHTGEQCISFHRLAKSVGVDIEPLHFNDVRSLVSDIVGFDVKDYIGNCLCLDALTFNEDRRFNNLSVIKTSDGYRKAPIFDNGLACLSDILSYPIEEDLAVSLKRASLKPYNSSLKEQILGNMVSPIKLDVNSFLNSVNRATEKELRALNVIKYGIATTEGIAWERF